MKFNRTLAVVLFAILLVAAAACAPAPTPSPTAAPPTAAPVATTAPGAPTSTAAPTAVPAPAITLPTRPIEFVISTAPGGGSDLYARAMQGIIEKYKLSPQPYLPVNKDGGSG